jgi:pyruvate dehydrogenase E2 component (dihydrolipoamide acetyltransferase)
VRSHAPAKVSSTTAGSPDLVSAAAEISPVAARMAAAHAIDLRQVAREGGRITKRDVQRYLDAQSDSAQEPAGSLIPASPKARRLAEERGLDITTLRGSGPDGAVLAADVMATAVPSIPAATPAAAGGPPETLAMSRAWQVMAERITHSWTTAPHFYLVREVAAGNFMAWRQVAQERAVAKITFTDLLIKVVAQALEMHPRVNASWINGAIHFNPDINIGLAVATDDGLIVPVIHGAGGKPLAQLAIERDAIVSRALSDRLKLDDLMGGTFTISNLGMYGIDAFNAVINPPQAAILAVGRIAERVVPVDGQPAVRPMMTLTLSLDHRVVDGARGAEFLDTLAGYIEEPLGML